MRASLAKLSAVLSSVAVGLTSMSVLVPLLVEDRSVGAGRDAGPLDEIADEVLDHAMQRFVGAAVYNTYPKHEMARFFSVDQRVTDTGSLEVTITVNAYTPPYAFLQCRASPAAAAGRSSPLELSDCGFYPFPRQLTPTPEWKAFVASILAREAERRRQIRERADAGRRPDEASAVLSETGVEKIEMGAGEVTGQGSVGRWAVAPGPWARAMRDSLTLKRLEIERRDSAR